MSISYNNRLARAISIVDYILEDNGHSIADAAEEFNLHKNTIEREISFLGTMAFYGDLPNAKELKLKYLNTQNILKKIKKLNCSKASTLRNLKRKSTSN